MIVCCEDAWCPRHGNIGEKQEQERARAASLSVETSIASATPSTEDDDPANMFLRAGFLHGLALRSDRPFDDHDREMLQRASRSLLNAARRAGGT